MDPDKFDDIIDDLDEEDNASENITKAKSKSGDSEFWKEWNKIRDAQDTAEEKEEDE